MEDRLFTILSCRLCIPKKAIGRRARVGRARVSVERPPKRRADKGARKRWRNGGGLLKFAITALENGSQCVVELKIREQLCSVKCIATAAEAIDDGDDGGSASRLSPTSFMFS